jgi:Fe2+ or Zn2+ uptake regulation protein
VFWNSSSERPVASGVPRSEIEQQLRAAGLRVTAPRAAVLETLIGVGDHPTVDTLVDRVRERLGHVSVQAVYDVCDALVRGGLARRIEPAGSPARFEARVGDNHHHFVCRRCGTVTDVDCAVGSAPCLSPDPSQIQGVTVDEAEVVYWGLCTRCRSATHERAPARTRAAHTRNRRAARNVRERSHGRRRSTP